MISPGWIVIGASFAAHLSSPAACALLYAGGGRSSVPGRRRTLSSGRVAIVARDSPAIFAIRCGCFARCDPPRRRSMPVARGGSIPDDEAADRNSIANRLAFRVVGLLRAAGRCGRSPRWRTDLYGAHYSYALIGPWRFRAAERLCLFVEMPMLALI